MKVECRSEDRRRAPESNTNNGRDKAQESQSRFRIRIVLVPSALFRGHSVGANSPDRLIKPIPSPGKLNAGATRPFFAPLALCDFAFNSGAKKSPPSHRVAVSRSDKIIIRAGCPRPFVAFLHPCACVPSGAGGTNQRTVARMQRRRIKLNQSGSK